MRRGSKFNRLLDYYLGIPVLRAFTLFRSRREVSHQARRIGVLCSPALGDTLLLSGVIADLRAHFPQQELIFFCTPQNRAAADLIPHLDKRVQFEPTRPLLAINLFRAEGLDVLLDFSPWQRLTAIYSRLSGAKFTVGFRTHAQYRHYGYDRVADHSNDRHEVENFRAVLHSFGVSSNTNPRVAPPTVPLGDELRGQELVVFHLWPSGSQSWLREWPVERWLQLARELQRIISNPLFVLTGSGRDRSRSEQVVHRLAEVGCRALVFTGTDGFATLCQVLLAARLVVSTNTGVMHLAALLGAPTVSINGPTNNERWGPIGPCAKGVSAPGDGCGFLDLGFEFAGNPTNCMQRISSDCVLRAAIEVMKMSERSPIHQRDGVLV